VVNPVKSFLSSSLITMHNFVAVSRTVCMHVEGPKNFGDARSLLLRMGHG